MAGRFLFRWNVGGRCSRQAGLSLSEWLALAAEARLRADVDDEEEFQRKMRGLDEYLDEYEAEHGAFTDEELARAAQKLGLPWPPEGEGA